MRSKKSVTGLNKDQSEDVIPYWNELEEINKSPAHSLYVSHVICCVRLPSQFLHNLSQQLGENSAQFV